MRSAVALIGAIFVVVTGLPAHGDPEVEPVPWSPKLHVRVEKEEPRTGLQNGGKPVARSNKSDLRFHCFPDRMEPGTRCALRGFADEPDPDNPELTEGDVLRAVREIGLPSLKVRIQPGEETLVNIETIFYTRPQAFERSITLLGFDIDLSAEPVRYTWVHDDGTASTTSRPGKPYPAMDVTHRYREPADDVHPRVDVTYRVRYRVDGGAWQTIGQTLLASGPAAELDVREAAPVLTRP